MLKAIDVSDFQQTVDWTQARHAVSFAYAQATYGCTVGSSVGAEDDYRNWSFPRNHDQARINGLSFGAYHFFLFKDDAEAQANAFLEYTQGRLGDLIPMVDVEGDSGSAGSVEANIEALAKFVGIVEAQLNGKKMLIYTGPGYWNDALGGSDAFAGHPLWVAHYGVQTPEVPTGWNDWVIWQYTSGATVPGVPGYCDADYLHYADLTEIKR